MSKHDHKSLSAAQSQSKSIWNKDKVTHDHTTTCPHPFSRTASWDNVTALSNLHNSCECRSELSHSWLVTCSMNSSATKHADECVDSFIVFTTLGCVLVSLHHYFRGNLVYEWSSSGWNMQLAMLWPDCLALFCSSPVVTSMYHSMWPETEIVWHSDTWSLLAFTWIVQLAWM